MAGLDGRVVFITGASRGIGLAIALRAAKDGAAIAIAAKTSEPHPKLAGTIHTAAKEIEAAGGTALPIQCDIRHDNEVRAAVDATLETFGAIDICINNASAISLSGTLETPMKRFDLMQSVNTRGTFAVSQACLPHLLKSNFPPHILTLSPPLNLAPRWAGAHLPYTLSKYGMSICTLGLAEEFAGRVAVNALWPKTTIATAAVDMLGGDEMMRASRSPEIVADAAYAILLKGIAYSGQFLLDEDVLRREGVSDAKLATYAMAPGGELLPDLFL